jgi:hypothetical protein
MSKFRFAGSPFGIHYEGDYKECPTKHYLSHEVTWSRGRGLQSTNREGYFSVGSAVHEGLASYYRGEGEGDAIARAVEYLEEEAKVYGGISYDTKLASIQQTMELLSEYVDHYPLERETFRVVQTEREVEVQLAPGHTFTVRIDLVVQDIPTGRFFVLEHKTTSQPQDKFEKQFALNPQITGSVFGAREAYKYPVTGVIVNAIRKKPVDFYRFPVLRDDKDIVAWVQDRVDIREEIARKREKKFWRRNEGSPCVDPLTGKECLFKPLCMYGESEQVFGGMYLPRYTEEKK